MNKYYLLILVFFSIASCSSLARVSQETEELESDKAKVIIIRGIVTDVQGKRLPQVSVLLERRAETETISGVVTSDSGDYTIIVSSDRTLVFSKTGYESKKIPVNGRDEIDVVLRKIDLTD